MIRKSVRFFFVFIIPFFLYLQAQTHNLKFSRLSIDNGLSNSYVTCILQDSKGFMWFGTQDGLNKYDGYNFTIYKHDQSNSNSLSDNYVRSVAETKDYILWIGTESGGLVRFDPITETFTRYQHQPDNPNNLSHNSILVIYEDPDKSNSILWIGTNGGGLNKLIMSKAEGSDPATNTFTHYTHDPDDTNSLSNNFVRAIHMDESGALWIGTNDGLNELVLPSEESVSASSDNEGANPESGKWTRYFHDPANPKSLDHSKVLSIYEDREGIIWIGTHKGLNRIIRNKGIGLVSQFDRKEEVTFIHYRERPGNPGFRGYSVLSILEDQFGKLWIGTHNGVNKFNKETGVFINYHHDSGNPKSLSGNMVISLYEDRSGLLWFGTGGSGISKLNRAVENFQHLSHIPGNPNSLSHPSVRGIYEDEDGILWVGGYGGLNRIDRQIGLFTQYLPDNSGLDSDLIYAIAGDYDDKQILWIGTEGGGLYKFDKNTGSAKHYSHNTGLPENSSEYSSIDNFIFDLYMDTEGILWIATGNGLCQMDKATDEVTVYKYIPNDVFSISSDKTRVIFEDYTGTLWIGTEADGLNRFNRHTKRFTRFLHDPDNPLSLSNNRIKSIYENNIGTLWIGTNGGGLNRFDRNTESFRNYTERNGLPNDVIYGILEDKNRNLWLSTNWGLSKFNPETELFRNYDVNDGLQSNEFNTASFFKSRNGEMFFGGINGLNTFFPEKIVEYHYAPPIVITDFQIFNHSISIGTITNGRTILQKHISETAEIQLTSKDNVISFEFTALSFAAPKKNKYAYIMEGVDKEWVFTDATRRFATYTHLDPGNYIFRVKGSNHDGVWNEEGTTIRIAIMPPLWKTWWAYLAYFMAGLGAIFGIIQYRLIQARIRTRQLERIVNVRTAEVERQKKKIEIQAEKLTELDKLKSRFFANISHEFRTPLTLIKGPLESLRNQEYGTFSKSVSRYLTLSLNNINRLQKLIDELLDLSKLGAGKLKLKAAPGDLTGFLHRIVDSFHSTAQKRAISLNMKTDNARIDLYFDEYKLEKVMNNLLSNALKFSQAMGRITVSAVDAIPEMEEKGTGLFVTIRVADNGKGIPPEAIPHVFNRFYQVDSSLTRKYEGTGIGLALTKELVELHGGEITVDSEVDTGTTFTITLPKGRAHLSDAEVIIKSERNKYVSEMDNEYPEVVAEKEQIDRMVETQPEQEHKILIVEDNAELRDYLRERLSSLYTIFDARDGKEGLNKALKDTPDLIISDIMMPVMNGIEMTRKLKQKDSTSIIPIILLTSRADEEDRIAGLETQADDYITKPFSLDELKVRIQNLIEGRQHLKKQFSQKVMIVKPELLNLDSVGKTFLGKILSAAEVHLSESNFNVQALANMMFIGKRQLERRLQVLTGLSPAEFIRQIRLKRAKQYLEEQALSTVAEVADAVGFDNVKYFSRLYYQAFGQFPSDLIRG